MATLFISDVHLSAARPAMVTALLSFLERQARDADALYILGDFFDQWLGDDDDTAPHPEVVAALARLVASGVPVRVMHGNHDFLLGSRFEQASGCQLLAEPAVIELYDVSVLIMHGDVLCTDDLEYQQLRRYTRDAENQRRFLRLPLAARAQHAAELRLASSRRSRLKREDIMDVNPHAVERAMQRHGVRHLIHGHTHRPGIYHVDLPSGSGQRIVLGDWYEQDSVLIWNRGGFRLARLQDLALAKAASA